MTRIEKLRNEIEAPGGMDSLRRDDIRSLLSLVEKQHEALGKLREAAREHGPWFDNDLAQRYADRTEPNTFDFDEDYEMMVALAGAVLATNEALAAFDQFNTEEG